MSECQEFIGRQVDDMGGGVDLQAEKWRAAVFVRRDGDTKETKQLKDAAKAHCDGVAVTTLPAGVAMNDGGGFRVDERS